VQVCPTGIDIRDGLQYQCIGCAACIDVCNEVMDKMGYQKGLVRYTTEHEVQGGKTHLFRPRIIIYAAILSLIFVALVIAVLNRVPVELDIIRDRNSLFREVKGGLVENIYNLRIVNMSNSRQRYQLSASGLEGMQLINPAGDFEVEQGEVYTLNVQIRLDPVALKRPSNEIFFMLDSVSGEKISIKESARFIGPVIR
jgi:cytochrome c oxidase accessory protein FixG